MLLPRDLEFKASRNGAIHGWPMQVVPELVLILNRMPKQVRLHRSIWSKLRSILKTLQKINWEYKPSTSLVLTKICRSLTSNELRPLKLSPLSLSTFSHQKVMPSVKEFMLYLSITEPMAMPSFASQRSLYKPSRLDYTRLLILWTERCATMPCSIQWRLVTCLQPV